MTDVWSREAEWKRQFYRMHGDDAFEKAELPRLRLILGTPRSGTSWLSEVLASTRTALRFFKEPIYKLEPPMPFGARQDHAASRVQSRLGAWHPLVMKYKMLTSAALSGQVLSNDRCALRADADWTLCLAKEVHSLLATKGLLRELSCPTVLLVRDPVRVCDSLLHRDGLSSIYAVEETRHVFEPAFVQDCGVEGAVEIERLRNALDREPDQRLQLILLRVLVIALIQELLRTLALEFSCARLVEYEKLCEHPEATFAQTADFLGFNWGEAERTFLAATLEPEHVPDDPHSILRRTKSQLSRPYRFFNRREVEWAYAMLDDVGLGAGAARTCM